MLFLSAAGCALPGASSSPLTTPQPRTLDTPTSTTPLESPTPLPDRPAYQPGELVDYIAQTGDTLPVLAARFNSSVSEILEANPFIPVDATTLPPGMPMQIPIYYLPFWGTPFQILPDSLFVYGPAQVGFDTSAFVASQLGWFARYTAYAAGANRSGAEIIDYVSENFSLSPRLLLALLEYHTGALTQPDPPLDLDDYPLDLEKRGREGLYLQLVLAANLLNNGYYGWRAGDLLEFDLQDGRVERSDPWQNAATVAFQHYFSGQLDPDHYAQAISPDGFARTYADLFGDPWGADQPHIPGSLRQPDLVLPFEPNKTWAYTGGPHTGWGTGAPFAAIDFAPPTDVSGCALSKEWATAIASGVVVRTDVGVIVLDLDGDSDERTGWNIFYLHIGAKDRPQVGTTLNAGDPIGHPSCEGGTSTGSHIHIARKYNGEWILADGTLAFNLEGWVAHNGDAAYKGTLTHFSQTIVASEIANQKSHLTAGEATPSPQPVQ